MEFVDMILKFATEWYINNNVAVNWIGGILFVLLVFVNKRAATAAGATFSLLLRGIKFIGKPLEKKTQDAVGGFYEGMRQDDQEVIKEKLKEEHPILNIEIPGEKKE